MRTSPLLAVLLLCCMQGLGCAGAREQQRREAWTEAYTYDLPLEELWPQVEEHFRARGFDVTPLGQPFLVVTDVQAEKLPGEHFAFTRYYARGEPMPSGSRVTIYRWTFQSLLDHRMPLKKGRQELDTGKAGVSVPSLEYKWLERDDVIDFQILSRERLARGEEGPGTPDFDRNFFRDLKEENALLTRIHPELAGNVEQATRALGARRAARLAMHVAQEAPGEVFEERCGEAIPGLADVVKPGGFLLLGELHGTQEVPRFVERAVCYTALGGTPVVLALELPASEQRALQRYLASEGGREDLRVLMLSDVWHRPYQDGRTSRAVLSLIEAVRVLNRQGLPVSLLAFDTPGLQGSAHDRAMAQQLLASRARERDSAFIVLTGNVHASTERGTSWDRDYEPLGWQLARTDYPVRALDAFYEKGSAWNCRLGPKGRLLCGEHPETPLVQHNLLAGKARLRAGVSEDTLRELRAAFQLHGRSRFFIQGGQYPPPGFHGVFFVTRLTASPPADPLTVGRALRAKR